MLRKCFLLWSVALLPSLLSAQEADSLQYRQLKRVSIREKTPYRIQSMPSQLITSEQMSHLPVKDFGDALKYMAGTQVKDYGGLGGLKTVSVRSLSASHTGVFYDGLPVSDCNSGQTNLGIFSRDKMTETELFSGSPDDIFQPARLLGSAATLLLNSAWPDFRMDEKWHGSAGLRGGSFGLVNPYLHLEHKCTKRTAATITAEYSDLKGNYPFEYMNGTELVRATRENAAMRSLRTEGNLFYRNHERSATAKAFYYRSDQHLPGAIVLYNPVCRQQMNEEVAFAQLHYHHNDLFHSSKRCSFKSNAKANYSATEYIDPDYLNAEHYLDNRYRQWEYYLSNILFYRPLCQTLPGETYFSLANDWTLNHMDCNLADFIPPTRLAEQTALSGKWNFPKGDTIPRKPGSTFFCLTAAMLHNGFWDRNEGGEVQYTQKWNPSANILFMLRTGHLSSINIRACYKSIFRMPTFSENYYRFFGSANLLPEEVRETDIGTDIRFTNGKGRRMMKGSADLFYNRVWNKIVAVPSQNLFVWTMKNYGQVDIWGVDGTLSLSDEQTARRLNLRLYANLSYSWQRALDMSNPESKTYRNQLPYTPRHSGSGMFGLEGGRLHIAYTLLWVGERYTLGQNSAANRLEPYRDHGVSVAYTIPVAREKLRDAQCRLQIDLLNLADRHYEVIRNYPMPGRQIQGKIMFQF